MKRLLLAIIGMVLMVVPSYALPVYDKGSETPLGNFTNVTAAVPAASTVITLQAPARHVLIKTDSGAAVMYFRTDALTCTASNFKLDSGASAALDGLPLITNITLLGASATGNYSILAW